jgi:hypothetical protein
MKVRTQQKSPGKKPGLKLPSISMSHRLIKEEPAAQ